MQQENKIKGVKLVLRALRNRNYRLFFMGQGISLIGTWMQTMAVSWLVYRLTNSPFLLGVVAFASQAPTFAFAPVAGILADRWNKHKIVIGTQILSMVQASILAILVLTGLIQVWHIIALSVMLGLINGFDIPTRQAFIYELVDNTDDLPNAIALNSMIFNGARLIGPLVAGVIVAAIGEGACFSINAVSYIAVLAALLSMQIKKTVPRHNGNMLKGIKEGIEYAYNFFPMRLLLLMLAYMSLIGMPYTVLLPVFARDVLHGGPKIYGLLLGGIAVGALIGAVFLASRKSVRGLGRIIVIAVIAFGLGILAFAFSRSLWLSLAFITLASFGAMVQMASMNTVIQTIVDDDKRGRIMSLYTMAFIGMTPFGSLLAGSLAHAIGATYTLVLAGVLVLLAAAYFAKKLPRFREYIRPVYVSKGIIPQVASGLGTTTTLISETHE
jgi:MFS family permease